MIAFQALSSAAGSVAGPVAATASETDGGGMLGAGTLGLVLGAGIVGLIVVQGIARSRASKAGQPSSDDILSKLDRMTEGAPSPEFAPGAPGLPSQAAPDTPLGRLLARERGA